MNKKTPDWTYIVLPRLCVFFGAGCGGNFLVHLLKQKHKLNTEIDINIPANEYYTHGDDNIGCCHLNLVWSSADNPNGKWLGGWVPSRWKQWLQIAKRCQTKFIVINSSDPYYTMNLSSVKYLLKNNLQVENFPRDIQYYKWHKRYKWAYDSFCKSNIPAQYFEYEDLFYNNTKHCLQQILDVNDVESYVQQIQDYNRKNKDIMNQYCKGLNFEKERKSLTINTNSRTIHI